MIRWAGILVLVFVLTIAPAAAQDTSVVDYVPADFAGFIRINTADPEQTAAALDVMAQVGSLIQPARFQYQDTLTLGNFVPVVDRFSQENATFADLILPWLRGELVLAYRQFDAELSVQPDDVLVIASAAGLFGSASSLSGVITGRNLTRKETPYPDVTVYTDDRVTLALAADAVLIGSETLVDAALAVRAGGSPALTGQAAYQAVHSALADNPLVFAYAAEEHALDALSGLVSGNAVARPLFPAFGEALTALDGMDSFGTRLINGQMDGIGVDLDIESPSESPVLKVTLAAHSREAAAPQSASVEFNPALLDFVPRSALLVHTGTDIHQGIYTILGAMPLANFAGQILGGVPVVTLGDAGNVITPPSSDDIQSAVEGFLAALSEVGKFNLKTDLLDHLSGNYVVALLPRPNDPLPVLNSPYELLLTADVKDGDAALAGVAKLMQALFDVSTLESETIQGWPFQTLRRAVTGEPLFSVGLVNNTLVIATGDAARAAVNAFSGDLRLAQTSQWETLAAGKPPFLYIDLAILINTLFSDQAGSVPSAENRLRLAVRTEPPQDDIYRLVITIPLVGS